MSKKNSTTAPSETCANPAAAESEMVAVEWDFDPTTETLFPFNTHPDAQPIRKRSESSKAQARRMNLTRRSKLA